MKTLRILTLAAVAAVSLITSGCVNVGKDYAKFISEMPGIEATGVSAETLTPFYSHKESASGVSTDPTTGVMTVVDGVAQIAIPLWGSSKTVRITGLRVQATPEQIAAAKAVASSAAQNQAKP